MSLNLEFSLKFGKAQNKSLKHSFEHDGDYGPYIDDLINEYKDRFEATGKRLIKDESPGAIPGVSITCINPIKTREDVI